VSAHLNLLKKWKKNHGQSSKIKTSLDYSTVIVNILSVTYKTLYTLAAELSK